ncbi:MAG: hypothetical protein MJA82_08435 [Clostridia bacterium]|nr:hypothetical protein [Clostridia bacterium]
MKEVIYELIISVIVLSLILVGIGLARNDVEIVQNLMERSDRLQKVSSDNLIDVQRSQVIGGDVISFIRYYSNDPSVTVVVTWGGRTISYVTETYDFTKLDIPYEAEFNNEVVYNGSKIEKIICEEK